MGEGCVWVGLLGDAPQRVPRQEGPPALLPHPPSLVQGNPEVAMNCTHASTAEGAQVTHVLAT